MQNTIPFAHQSPRRMITHGVYKGGYPKGAIVHFTAGQFSHGISDAQAAIDIGIKNKYTYLCIARTGELMQAHDVSRWGYHAGESAWRNKTVGNLVGSVSDDLIGIEMNNAGVLQKLGNGQFHTYWGQAISSDQVRFVTEKEWGCPTGYYHKYNPEQEATLIRTILWLKANDPTGGRTFNFFDVLAHHEVSGKAGIGFFRKSDCGGSLSMPMDQFRAHLKALWSAQLSEKNPTRLP